MPSLEPDDSPTLRDLFSLEGRTSLVIGGAGYLGKEISFALAELGSHILIASRDIEKNIEFAKLLNAKFENVTATPMQVDITDQDSVDKFFGNLAQVCPDGLDVLVNCGWTGKKNNLDSISMEDWKYDLDLCPTGGVRII